MEQHMPSRQANFGFIVGLLVLGCLSACQPNTFASYSTLVTPRPTTIVAEVMNDPAAARLIAQLRSRGIELQASDQSRVALLSDAPGQAFSVFGASYLHVHLYPTAAAASDAVPNIVRLYTAGEQTMEWVAAPHFYRCDALIVLYAGSHPFVISSLAELCGPQFVGPSATRPAP